MKLRKFQQQPKPKGIRDTGPYESPGPRREDPRDRRIGQEVMDTMMAGEARWAAETVQLEREIEQRCAANPPRLPRRELLWRQEEREEKNNGLGPGFGCEPVE